jgi:amino acid transporter
VSRTAAVPAAADGGLAAEGGTDPHTGLSRSIGPWAFLGVTVTSLGGPLALAALYAPGIVADASGSAGLSALAAAVVFGFPLVIWLRYARDIHSAGGQFSFVEAAAGRRVAMVQAVVWIISYVLYLLDTTGSVVFDTLPAVWPGIKPYQSGLEVAIPVLLAAVMLAGRTVTLITTGVIAAGQMALVAVVDGVTVGHAAPIASFGTGAPAGPLATSVAQTALLYICGSLPLFLGGEVVRPRATVRRGLVAGYLLVVAAVVVAVFPLASDPAFTHASIPGMSVVKVFAGNGLAKAVGVGVAVSIVGVMLVEFLALSRLLTAVSKLSLRKGIGWLSAALVVAGPVSLIDPDAFYDNLIKPSLFALWISQLIVFAVYPRYAVRKGSNPVLSYALGAIGVAFAVYGLWAVWHHHVS